MDSSNNEVIMKLREDLQRQSHHITGGGEAVLAIVQDGHAKVVF